LLVEKSSRRRLSAEKLDEIATGHGEQMVNRIKNRGRENLAKLYIGSSATSFKKRRKKMAAHVRKRKRDL
jgi:hypothetical protein